MGWDKLFGSLAVLPVVLATPAMANSEKPAQIDAVTSSSFALVSPSVAPPRDLTLRPAAADPRKPEAIMPREVPAVVVDDATPFPVPGYDWQTPNGGLLRVRPAKVRFKMGF